MQQTTRVQADAAEANAIAATAADATIKPIQRINAIAAAADDATTEGRSSIKRNSSSSRRCNNKADAAEQMRQMDGNKSRCSGS
jgi:hypothetical protein